MNRTITAALAALAIGAATVSGCSSDSGDSAQPLTVGWVVDPCWSQVPVAQDAGYFEQSGVDVEVVPFPTGAAALEALSGGAVDVATGGDVPTSAAALKNPDVRVIADGARWDGGRFVARRSAGIDSIADLSGRQIAVPLGSSAHYFATKFLDEAGVEAELVQTGPSEVVTAITNRDVDAVAVFQPPLAKAVAALGDDGVELQGRQKYNQHSLYLTTADTLAQREDDLSAFLGAVRQADAPLTDRDPKALSAVAKATGLDDELIGGVAKEFQFDTRLGPELPADLADRARWAQSIGRIPQDAQVPDYATIVVAGPLDGSTK
ncbi:ABC transporter substrate-binding protein [Mycolicibacterium arseniciresistens]|uniref:NrtA/SsuA/CpmA family ABC transporter substrate-binding protein n=1 Tax=Mycolicibacterium arseniciresistens TaxID=3062257 RepID=A0ABT8UHT0_9MYCO|nr:NrtA/SsuA/CpmA family ABC transporter substrate-binding protein [Mycolicibacterium arseniciresistens]MDO3637359.1 NrtA/SsuA/CpmA family ABC transporter substrate-binding protein [Mycolicibacterium arseniciresistens]